MELKSGTEIQGGRYRIIRTLGRGGFGITYLAEQVMAKRNVCIKEFFPKDYYTREGETNGLTIASAGFAETMDKFRAKFTKEAQTIAALDHPNIIPIHDVFEENNTSYYVMEYIEGEALNSIVKRHGALSEDIAVGYIRQVADALGHIHEQHIMHLDVKPGNIMLRSKDNRAILIDFGLSKHYDANSGEATSTSPVGVSHGYAPMEQYRQGGVSQFSPETDIYSLGATLYYLVTGSTPPEATIVADDGLPKLPTHLSRSVRTAIEQAMADKRRQRPQTIKAFLDLLDNDSKSSTEPLVEEKTEIITKTTASTSESSPKQTTSPEHTHKPKRRHWWLWVIISAIVAVVALYFILAKGDDSAQADSITELFNKGVKYCDQGDYTEAIKYFKRAAEQGDAAAQYKLGSCYYYGKGVAIDYIQAVEWYRKAAEQGDAAAQYALGVCYNNGEGVTQDFDEAIKWCRKAAEQGDAYAQYSLGYCYYYGNGVAIDYIQAVEWYRKAAEQGDAYAQYSLGVCYSNGEGVTQDFDEAIKWYRKAAEQGNAYAQCALGVCYSNGEGVTQDFDEAIKWYRKAAEQGDAYAQYNLGVCYSNGEGVTQDYNKAAEWFSKAAEQGNTLAQERLEDLGESW